MLRPNLYCTIEKHVADGHNVFGEEVLSPAVREPCAIVKLRHQSQHTTVRADSSGSRGHGDEFLTNNKILLMANTIADLNDKMVIQGVSIRIISKFPRHHINGTLDHYEIEGEIWE
jgi:hypothetical protein